MYRAGMAAIFSQLAREGRLAVVDSLKIEAPKTKLLAAKFKAMNLQSVLVISDVVDDNLYLASRNLPNVLVVEPRYADPLSLVHYKKVLVTKAAIDQLKVLGGQIGVDVYAEPENKDPRSIAENALKHAKTTNKNVIIIDTAGRLAVDEVMMNEVAGLKAALQPQEILFVVDSMTGQDAVNTAKAFNEKLDFTGVVLTKLDGDTRGGAALSIKYTVQKPIKFISSGEKMETLDVFHPDRMAQRILGMGDIASLVERAQAQFDDEQVKKLEKKIRKNQFDFQDFLDQLQQIKKMGNLKDLMGMIPGMGKAMKDIDISDDAFKGVESIISSMTPFERSNPDVIDLKRKQRIAKGCGRDMNEVNQFFKQFEQMKQMMKGMNNMPAMPRMGGRR